MSYKQKLKELYEVKEKHSKIFNKLLQQESLLQFLDFLENSKDESFNVRFYDNNGNYRECNIKKSYILVSPSIESGLD